MRFTEERETKCEWNFDADSDSEVDFPEEGERKT